MTTLLSPEEVDALRSLKSTAVILLLMIRLDQYHPGQAFREEQLAPIVEMDARTVTKHLQSLSARNRVLLTRTGWVLTEGGRALFLAASQNGQALSPGENQALSRNPAGLSPANKTGTEALDPFSPETQAQSAETSPANTHTVCALEEEDSLIHLKFNDSSSSESSAQSLQAPLKVRVLLEKTYMLFSKPVFWWPDADELDAREVLGWIAQAYDQRETPRNPRGLFAPWGMVYRSLRDGRACRAEYRISPAEYLPAEYLRAVGYPVKDEGGGRKDETQPDDEADRDPMARWR